MSISLRIYEIYGGGGNSSASPYQNDYVSLYNAGNADVDLSGYHLQYSSASGVFNANLQVNLAGSIAAHGYYLIKLSGGSSGAQPLKGVDLAGSTLNISSTTGKLALVSGDVLTGSVMSSTPGVVDFVGYGGSANASEGSPAVAPSNIYSITRLLGGAQDTNNNASDFLQTNPTPLSSASPHNTIPCYCTGTLILTVRGQVPVEVLAVGDLVVTASGAQRPIRWIGHRRTDVARHPRPDKVMPVRILAGAVAPGVPARDLLVSPGHAVVVDGVLVKAERLVNGATIIREDVAHTTYWHVELDRHDLLVAEGMAAESYVECGNRHAFANGGPVMVLHPEFDALSAHAATTCLPLVDGGAALVAVRERLIAQAGERFSADPAVTLVADGTALAPVTVDGRRYGFVVPEGTQSLRLVSRSGVAGEVMADSRDRLRLGVAVRGLTVDGVAVSCEALGQGWHAQALGRDHRWSDGDAALPLGREIGFTAFALDRYPVANGTPHRAAA